MTEALVFDSVRTPRGRGRPSGALHAVKPVALIVGLIHALGRRVPGLDLARVEDLVLGVVSARGEQGGVLSRAAAMAAGLDVTLPGVQLNRYCASGLEAVNVAAQKVRSGWEDLVLAGGVESMSRVPMTSDGPWPMDPEIAYATHFVPQGVSADLLATVESFTRTDVDAYAAESQRRAHVAQESKAFDQSIEPTRDRSGLILLAADEPPRPGTTVETLAGLPPAFADLGSDGYTAVALQKFHWLDAIDHVHTAGNSSCIVDGAALVVVGSERIGQELGMAPRARIVACAAVATDPTIMLTGPAPAVRKALGKAGLSVGDIDLFEINEAFAAVVLAFLRELGVPHEKVNVNGGAIALGHPLGATGAILVGTLIDELERRQQRYGVAALCVGGGMGVATIVERL